MADAIELFETRDANETSGKLTCSRKFAVWDDSSPLLTPSAVRALFGTTQGSTLLPKVGDLFPDETDVFCVSYQIALQPNSRNLWHVTFSYENTEPGQLQPLQVGYAQLSFDWSAEFRDVWRTQPGLIAPSDGDATLNSTIQGTPIDVWGEPMSVLRYFTTLEISETVQLNTLDARAAVIMEMRGKRNAAVFRGGAIGTVLYRGAKANRTSIDKVSLTHSFMQDDWYHMIQVPERGSDGRVVLTEAANGARIAASVLWRQPFPLKGDFNTISENF